MKKIFFKIMIISAIGFFVISTILHLGMIGAHNGIYTYLKYNDINALNILKEEVPKILIISMISGFLYGLFMSIFSICVHYLSLKKIKYKDIHNYSKIQTGEIEIVSNLSEAFQSCIKSLKAINGKVLTEDIDTGYIKAKASMKYVYCYNIEFNLTKINDSLTKIIIKSEPITNSDIYLDSGRNFENVQKIIKYFEKNNK